MQKDIIYNKYIRKEVPPLNTSQNKLGTMPIGPLLIKMSIPMMVSMLVQALYNIVDSMFVARISENALTAVSLAFPVQMIMGAIAVGTGVGANAYISRSLGMRNIDDAEKAANVQIFLSFIYTIIFTLIGIFGVRSFFESQTNITEIVDYGTEYLTIVCTCCLGAFFCQNFEKLLVAVGNSAASMIAQASGAIFNMVFDWLLIFGIGPFPEMGIRGAAVATVLGQLLSALLAFLLCLKNEPGIKFSIKKIRPDLRILSKIYAIGVPSMITVGLNSLMSFLMNQILLGFSTTATAVFGVWLKLQSFGFMPVFGMNNGTIAIYSFNFGAGNIDRIKKTLRLALIIGFTVTSSVALLYELIPSGLLAMFDASESMLNIGIPALRVLSISLPFGAISVILSSSLQTLGKSHYSLFVNLCRQLIILLPAAWMLSFSGNLRLVWLSGIIAEALTMVISIILSKSVYRMLDKRIVKN